MRWRRVAHVLLGTGTVQAANIVTYVLLARLLDVPEYGAYRQLFVINQIVWAVLFSAAPTTLLFFCGSTAAAPSERAAIIRTHLWLVGAVAATVAAALLLGARPISRLFNNATLAALLPSFALYPAAFMVQSLVAPVLVATERTARLPAFTVLAALLGSVPVLTVAWRTGDLAVVVPVATIAALAGGLVALALILAVSRGASRSSVDVASIAAYAAPLLAAGGISMIGLRIDQIVVSHLLGPATFALYAVGAFELPIYSLIKSSSTTVLMPELTAAAQRRSWSAALGIWADLQRKNSALILPISAALVAFAEPFITVVFGRQYRDAWPVFAIFTLLGPVRSITFGLFLRALGRPWLDLAGAALFLVLVCTVIHPAVVFAGLIGAAVTVVMATCVVAVVLLVLTKHATGGAVTVRQLYPPRLLGAYLAMLGLFALLRLGAELVETAAAIQLLLGGTVTALLSLGLLYGYRRKVMRA